MTIMDKGAQLMSDAIIMTKYANWREELQRRESFEEIVDRYMGMMRRRFSNLLLNGELDEIHQAILERRILPSMRGMQFGGFAIEQKNTKLYNCCYLPMDCLDAFGEAMYLLLCGTGVGYSVRQSDIDKLPEIKQPLEDIEEFYIEDSIEGWADAIKALLASYFNGSRTVRFHYFLIRPEGALIRSSGSAAPGPEPLRAALENIRALLDSCIGRKLTTLDAHDVVCHLSDAVRAGGVRRSAMISIFDPEDELMLHCKDGDFFTENPQRQRANNTTDFLRETLTRAAFDKVFDILKDAGSGEPGVYLTNNRSWGFNPCNEAALPPWTFCNLTTINAAIPRTQAEFERDCFLASLLGTMQATFTDFKYLRPLWSEATRREALIGVSLTGVAEGYLDELDLRSGAQAVVDANKHYAALFGINQAARCTLMKPEGTSTLALGASGAGIHDVHSTYYVRRVELEKNHPLHKYLEDKMPGLLEDSMYSDKKSHVCVPMRCPDYAHVRTRDPAKLLERIKRFYNEWVVPGHNRGDNTHNISATISVPTEAWEFVREWMWENQDSYNGLSIFPMDDAVYPQTPYTDSTKEEFDYLTSLIGSYDLRDIIEEFNTTKLSETVACAGGSCEIKSF